MNEFLLLTLGISAEHPIHWLHWDAVRKQIIDQGQADPSGDLGALVSLAIRTPSYALVSNAAVLTTEVQLPNDSRRALEAIPYQLEEQLAEDIEALHFAVGKATGRGRYPVAVVARSLMENWQQWLLQTGIPINALLVDAQSIATDPQQLQIIPLQDQILIRHPDGRSCSFPSEQAEHWITLAESQLGLPIASDALQPHSGGLAQLAGLFAPEHAINLLQGRYKLKDPVKQLLNAWKLPALLLGLILAVAGGQLLWQAQQLQRQQLQLDQQISVLFSSTLPGSRLVNPRVQLETELKQLQQRSQGSDFLRLLQQSLPAFNSTQGLQIKNMLYQASPAILTLELEAASHTMTEQFVTRLTEAGVSAQIQSSRQQNDHVSAQLIIKGER